jgi:hypothetical protein
VEILDGHDHICGVEPRDVGREPASSSKMTKELATLHKLHEHVKILFVLKRAKPFDSLSGTNSFNSTRQLYGFLPDHFKETFLVQVDNSWIGDRSQDFALVIDVLDLFEPDDFRLVQDLEGEINGQFWFWRPQPN